MLSLSAFITSFCTMLSAFITSFCIPHSERLPPIVHKEQYRRKYCADKRKRCKECCLNEFLYHTNHYNVIYINHHDKTLRKWSRTYRNNWKDLAHQVGWPDIKNYDYDYEYDGKSNKKTDDNTFYIHNNNYKADLSKYNILRLTYVANDTIVLVT